MVKLIFRFSNIYEQHWQKLNKIYNKPENKMPKKDIIEFMDKTKKEWEKIEDFDFLIDKCIEWIKNNR